MSQKFHKGDHVRVAKDLGPSMSHFESNCEAIVIGSYKDRYGGSGRNERQFTIHIKDRGQTSWYYEEQLTLIETGRLDLLQQWETEAEAKHKQQSDLDWIFANGAAVIAKPNGSALGALGHILGIDNLWGASGEGITYYYNAMAIMHFATPFLEAGDRTGFEAAARSALTPGGCRVPPAGWRCTRESGHEGPCAAVPV